MPAVVFPPPLWAGGEEEHERNRHEEVEQIEQLEQLDQHNQQTVGRQTTKTTHDGNVHVLSEKDKTRNEPINNAKDKSIHDQRPRASFDAFTYTSPTSASPSAPTSTSTSTSTAPFPVPFIPFTHPPTRPPSLGFPHPFPTPANFTGNYNASYKVSTHPQAQPQKRLRRVRVYHLQNRWPADTMDKSRRASSASSSTSMTTTTTTTTLVPDHAAAPRPPPLPLSTSSFAFERPSLGGGRAGQDDDMDGNDNNGDEAPGMASSTRVAASIAFIHQPNPDYANVGDEETLTAATATAPPPAELPPSPSVSTVTETLPALDTAATDELLSVLGAVPDDAAAGDGDWGRHTRVYGGGVCLACLAAESSGGQGGEYGASVPMEQRR
ncbi:hypothetical protein SPBR_01679 [Sporothrix brasiliensis 5110]|uniref:Uncharacterized protein n=1 Tax=Sporothrix brasiliensis 5110 TaxID=1398154 RepID=A0A0C2IWR3_9PEZI|nr:uncharacterized protein SPBR_01679 [Sporothrix brasiliensis 5110]KIH91180.1 hypothetical protein SPBR_01679 [Sporothrix brasiliensis 5110]